MGNISSTTVIIVELIAVTLIIIFRQKHPPSKYKGLLTKVCFVIAAIMVILAIYTVFFIKA